MKLVITVCDRERWRGLEFQLFARSMRRAAGGLRTGLAQGPETPRDCALQGLPSHIEKQGGGTQLAQ